MSKYFGLDYGTTMSLIYSYNDGKLHKECGNRSAALVLDGSNGPVLKIGNEALDISQEATQHHVPIESPKRSINNLDDDINGITYRQMIETLLTDMIEQADIDRDSHITLTIPNGYSATNYIDMYNILSSCLNKIFAHNHSIKIHLLPEPVAAALFYVLRHNEEMPDICRLVVCDIGGGTTDLCIIECQRVNARLTFEVKALQQTVEIGGNKFDKKIEDNKLFPIGLKSIEKRIICQRLKCQLSNKDNAVEYIGEKQMNLTRDEFESYIQGYLSELFDLMRTMYKESNMAVDESWYLLPIGGSCKIIAIRQLMQDVFQGAHQTYEEEKTIFDGVAQGAAIYSAWCAKALSLGQFEDILIKDLAPHEIQFKTANGSWQTLVPKNSPNGTYPASNEGNVKPLNIDEKAGGKYTVGEIKLKEAGTQGELTRVHDIPFSLRKRSKEEIILQLGVKIENGHIVKWWLKDCETGESQIWDLESGNH